MEFFSAFGIALGVAIATGLKYFAMMFMGYWGLRLASKIFGPLKLFEN